MIRISQDNSNLDVGAETYKQSIHKPLVYQRKRVSEQFMLQIYREYTIIDPSADDNWV